MSLSSQAQNVIGATVGSAGVTSPVWFDLVPPIWQGFIAVLGAVVLVVTGLKAWTEWRLAQRRLRDLDGK